MTLEWSKVSPCCKRMCSTSYKSSNVCKIIFQLAAKDANIFSLRVAVCFILFLVTNYIEEGQFLEKKNHALG